MTSSVQDGCWPWLSVLSTRTAAWLLNLSVPSVLTHKTKTISLSLSTEHKIK